MKHAIRVLVVFTAAAVLPLTTVIGGTEAVSSGKEMKQIAPAPPPMCEWGGFYVGLNAGGQFGHSETFDSAVGRRFGYSESGFSGGIQVGYNFQWHWLVIGPEFDIGYMNLEGSGEEPGFSGIVHAETDSDFFTTMRGRIGVTLDWHGCWLIYGTGGAIGVDYTTRFHVDPDFFDARSSDFNWGYTVGGGIERRLSPRWSVKAEYLYFSLDDQSFGNIGSGVTADFDVHTTGHIVRGGLNYRF